MPRRDGIPENSLLEFRVGKQAAIHGQRVERKRWCHAGRRWNVEGESALRKIVAMRRTWMNVEWLFALDAIAEERSTREMAKM